MTKQISHLKILLQIRIGYLAKAPSVSIDYAVVLSLEYFSMLYEYR
jgi:hypothetical protein